MSLAIAIERARQNRAARALELTTARAGSSSSDGARVGTFIAGDRVFDTVTGETGEVIHAARENVIVSTPK